MVKNNLVYLLMLSCLFWGFISVLDGNRLKANAVVNKVSDDILKYEWAVTEVKNIYSRHELTEDYNTTVFQFLSSGGFVAYENKLVRHTGSWKFKNNQLEIEYDDHAKEAAVYQVELVRPEEMLMLDGKLQMRLMRL